MGKVVRISDERKAKAPVSHTEKVVPLLSPVDIAQDAFDFADDGHLQKAPAGALTNAYSLQNLAIISSYFSVGLVSQLLATPAVYYLIEEGASSGVTTVYTALVYLPWSFKVFYGFLSDCLPIRGLRRKPYFVMGWGVHIVCNAALALMGTPGAQAVILLSFLSACGYLMSDVMTDAIVVERTKLESSAMRGTMQASGYIARYFGTALGAVGGTVLYNSDSWGWGLSIAQLFALSAMVPLVVIVPCLPFLLEVPAHPAPGILKRHCNEIWLLVQKRAVWEPMIFIYLYNALMIPNAAWSNFLVDGLGFSDFYLGVVTIAGAVFAWLGLVVYKAYFLQANWRTLYVVITIVVVVLSLLQLALVLGWSSAIGIPDLLFAAGDETAIDFVQALQFLPICVMYAVLCPGGSEGTSYAMLTTLSNVAYSVAYAIGDLLTDAWDVSNEALEEHDYSGMWKLTLFTSVIQALPIVLVGLLPASKEDQIELQKNSSSSYWGGLMFLTAAGASIAFSLGQSLWEIFV